MAPQNDSRGPRRLAGSELLVDEREDTSLRKPTWSLVADELKLEVWRERYFKDGPESFAYRSIYFHISEGRKLIASGRFVEWSGPALSHVDDFLYAADQISQADHDTAYILLTMWGQDNSPLDYGTVVRFERLGTEVSSRSSAIWALISRVIAREFRRRGAILMLKAFPLEYEGQLTRETPRAVRQRLERRCKAMLRHYRRRLGVIIVPGKYGADGWTWRPLRYCPSPLLY